MKTIYLVKKNPLLPSENDNWIIMDGKTFLAFKKTQEGMKRSNHFLKLVSEYDEECIVMECDPDHLSKWKSDINRTDYARKRNKEMDYRMLSYNLLTVDDEELCGEEILPDASESMEDSIINKIELERILQLLTLLGTEDRRLIYSFFFTENPIREEAYARSNGMSQQTVHFRKERALKRLRNLYFNSLDYKYNMTIVNCKALAD